MCKWHCQYEVENNECVISDYEVSQMMLRGWVWVILSKKEAELSKLRKMDFDALF